LLREDEVGGVRSKPQQRDIGVTHSDSRPAITQDNQKGSRAVQTAKVEKFSIKGPIVKNPTPPCGGDQETKIQGSNF
jgi:hypothetical protein